MLVECDYWFSSLDPPVCYITACSPFLLLLGSAAVLQMRLCRRCPQLWSVLPTLASPPNVTDRHLTEISSAKLVVRMLWTVSLSFLFIISLLVLSIHLHAFYFLAFVLCDCFYFLVVMHPGLFIRALYKSFTCLLPYVLTSLLIYCFKTSPISFPGWKL